MGKISDLVFEIQFQEYPYKGWVRWQEQNADRQFGAGFSPNYGLMKGPPGVLFSRYLLSSS